jgi:hypothetical protein
MTPTDVINTIRESFGASISIYSFGNCYQFYEILKTIFPTAEAFYDGNHVWTKIDKEFYDIRGKHDIKNAHLIPITDPELIESLSKNKWTDERRMNLKNKIK